MAVEAQGSEECFALLVGFISSHDLWPLLQS